MIDGVDAHERIECGIRHGECLAGINHIKARPVRQACLGFGVGDGVLVNVDAVYVTCGLRRNTQRRTAGTAGDLECKDADSFLPVRK